MESQSSPRTLGEMEGQLPFGAADATQQAGRGRGEADELERQFLKVEPGWETFQAPRPLGVRCPGASEGLT